MKKGKKKSKKDGVTRYDVQVTRAATCVQYRTVYLGFACICVHAHMHAATRAWTTHVGWHRGVAARARAHEHTAGQRALVASMHSRLHVYVSL